MLAHLLDGALSLYGRFVPYHPGRWRITKLLSPIARSAWTRPRIIRRGGIIFEANLAHDEVCRTAYTDNLFDPYESTCVKRIVKPGWVCFDVGSNIGYYALLFSKLVGPLGKVFAFEPIDFTFDKMRRNLALNNATNVTALREAVGSEAGSILIAQEGDNHSGIAHVSDVGEQRVPVTTVDACVERFGLTRLDFLKSDVEGYELHVLRGAERSICRFRPYVIVEIAPHGLSRYDNTPEDIISWLDARGYDLFQARWHGLRRLRKLPTDAGDFINVIGLPRP